LGFGVAEAMDTAQRFSIGWPNARHLIEETGRLRLSNGFIAGAGTDAAVSIDSDDDAIASVVDEAEAIRAAGGLVIVLPLPHLALSGADERRYVDVYRRIIDRLDGPLFLHWLGEAFMPGLAGYFPGDSFFEIMGYDTHKVRGAKLSLLDSAFERSVRERLLPDRQFILTGDDFNFGELMLGDDQTVIDRIDVAGRAVPLGHFSHALLGILDAIATPAARALAALNRGDRDQYKHLMAAGEELGQWIFQTPTHFYKSGLAYLAWLNGLQPNAMLLNHEEQMRDREYYDGVYRLATAADALIDPTLAEARANDFTPFAQEK
jgi:hypothetical protein